MQIISNTILPIRRKGFVRRQRLLDALYQSLDFKLALVTAAAGYGKTSLLVDYAHDIDLPVCWLTLDQSDRDPARLLSGIIASIAQRFPEFGELTRSALADDATADEAVGALINELVTAVPELFVLILDDYHLADTAPVGQVIERLLRFLPDQVRLILSGRSTPSIDLISLAAKQEVFSIAPADLCFTAEETRALLEQMQLPRPLDPKELTQQMHGWVTGIVLATQQQSEALAQVKPTADALDVIYVYLAQEVLAHQAPAVREFLLKTSILRWMTEDACNAILGRDDTAEILDHLQIQHLFIELVREESEVQYRYHPLFQEFLFERLEVEAPDQVQPLHQEAGKYFAQQGAIENAINHFLAAEALEQAAPLIDSLAMELRRKNQRDTLFAWRQRLGTHANSAPNLLLALAIMLLNQGDYPQSKTILNELIDDSAVPSEIRAQAKVQKGFIWFSEGHIDKTMELLEPLIDEDQVPSVQASALRVMGLCHQQRGEPYLARERLLTALESQRRLGSMSGVSHILIDLSVVLLPLGEIETALRCQDEALEILRNLGRSSLLASNLNNSAFARHLLGQFQAAADLYQDALIYAQQSGRLPDKALITLGQADLLRDVGQLETAVEFYQTGLSISEAAGQSWLRAYAQIGLTTSHRLLANLELALSYLESITTTDAYLNARRAVEEGMILGIQGKVDQGLQAVKQGRDGLYNQKAFPDLAVTELQLGDLQLQAGNLSEAAAALNRALEAGGQCDDGDMRLAIEARYHPDLLALGQEHNVNLPALNRLRQQIHELDRASAEFTLPTTTPDRIPELWIFSLGETRLQHGEQQILAADWRRASARSLFFYIADHPQVRRSDLIFEFWPDSPRNKATSRLHSTLYDARRAVGSEFLVYQAKQESYLLNPDAQIWYDVAEFEKALEQAKQKAPGRERARFLRQAIDLYTGPYLSDIDTMWASERRNYLERAFLEAVIDLGDCYLTERDFGEAQKWYQQALKLDNYREDVHRRVMLALTGNGRKAEALRHYQQCVQILGDELGIAPDPATRALAQEIRSS